MSFSSLLGQVEDTTQQTRAPCGAVDHQKHPPRARSRFIALFVLQDRLRDFISAKQDDPHRGNVVLVFERVAPRLTFRDVALVRRLICLAAFFVLFCSPLPALSFPLLRVGILCRAVHSHRCCFLLGRARRGDTRPQQIAVSRERCARSEGLANTSRKWGGQPLDGKLETGRTGHGFGALQPKISVLLLVCCLLLPTHFHQEHTQNQPRQP